MFHAHHYIRSVFTYVNTSFYDLACRHSENCVENKSIAMSCGEYVLRTNEIFSCGKYHTNALLRSLRNSPWIRNLYEISEKARMNSDSKLAKEWGGYRRGKLRSFARCFLTKTLHSCINALHRYSQL